MKLVSLNTWSGRAGNKKLLDFFVQHKDTDIFCLQEMWEGGPDYVSRYGGEIDIKLMTHVSKILGEHASFFRPHFHDWYGLAIFAKKDLKIVGEGEVFVVKEKENAFDDEDVNHARNIQYLTIETQKGLRTIINFHGLWNGNGKDDTEERLLQSDNIAEFVKGISNPYILCGDFNLLPETKSLKKLEDLGMRNLIKEFNITSTRSSHYKKPIRFADYTLASEGISVHDFKVLPDEVSDHLAMYLDFE